ncbi:epithelial cell adhesion molecule-like isoform X1 [Polypterus senegalus]|uniref:epithelial cell adhesion molecule-like isoform X1 n=1 Tax=Polypterus senegalus TaxID=55291 RepID=UPI0019624151|nr:epithelial cell adhesion molecule-like isoform X1 [Polypterus senegalus]
MKMKTLFVISALIFESTFDVSAVPDDECPDAFPARENCEFDEVCEDSFCKYNEFVTCHLNRCGTCEAVFRGHDNLTVNCNQLTPKCRLMHLEMLDKSKIGRGHPGGRLDMDSVYDPECEKNGTFKAKQCDDDSNLCWCVDSAGVRVTDKTGDDPKCDRLVRVHLIQILFIFNSEFTFHTGTEEEVRRKLAIKLVKQYTLKATQILEISIQEHSHEVSIRLSENGTQDPVDVATVAYYIERDLKKNKFDLEVDGRNLEVEGTSIKVLVFDNEPPRINMKTISPGFAAIIIVIALVILTGIAVFVVVRRRAEQEKQRFQFEVIEGQELDDYNVGQREIMGYYY